MAMRERMRGNCWKRRAARCWPEREPGDIPALRRSYLERGNCFVSAIGLAFIPLGRPPYVVSGIASPCERFQRTVVVWLKASLPVLSRTTENRHPSRLPPLPGARTDRTKRGGLRQCVAARLDSTDGPTGRLRFEPGGGGRCLACA